VRRGPSQEDKRSIVALCAKRATRHLYPGLGASRLALALAAAASDGGHTLLATVVFKECVMRVHHG